jgi:IS5 family transposase
MSWDNFNESGDLKAQVQSPFMQIAFTVQGKTEHGVKKKELESVGPPLGRPPANVSKAKKRQALEDERIRNAICQKVWAR